MENPNFQTLATVAGGSAALVSGQPLTDVMAPSRIPGAKQFTRCLI